MMPFNKNIIMAAVFVALVLLAYQFAFSKTFEIKTRLNELKSQIEHTGGIIQNKADLETKEIYLDSIIAKSTAGDVSLQNNLLNVLNKYSEKYAYKIISFKEPHLVTLQNEPEITTFQFVLQGEYKNLENILFTLEREYSFGTISHIGFEKKTDYRLRKDYLQCTVMIQNIR